MPLVGTFHAYLYAMSDGAPPEPPAVESSRGYPLWQSAPTTCGLWFTGLDALWDKIKWIAGIVRRLWWWERREELEAWIGRIDRMSDGERRLLDRAARLVEQPEFALARESVRATATTIGFGDPQAWIPYSRAIKSDPGQAENTFRHLRSVMEVKNKARERGVKMTNPDANLLVELAYQEFGILGK